MDTCNKEKGGQILWSVVVIDRMQGGRGTSFGKWNQAFSMINIDIDFSKRFWQWGLSMRNNLK